MHRWFLFRASPLRDESGNIVQWYGTNADIEERKCAEEALRSNEQKLRQIVDTIPGIVCTLSATGEVQLLNRQILEYFGKTSDELKDWVKLFEGQAEWQDIVLDLKDVGVVDREAMRFFARCEADGVQLENCTPYIREWMEREKE